MEQRISRVRRGVVARKNGEASVLVAYVSTDLAKAARVRAMEEGRTVSDLVGDMLSKHLGLDSSSIRRRTHAPSA